MSEEQGTTAVADRPEEPERIGRYTPPREAVVDVLRRRLEGRLQEIESGPWEGVRVVTAKDLDEALAEKLPAASLFAAEVRTPGYVTVAAVCPRCGIPQDTLVELTAQLVVETGHAEIKVKGKSKARTHACYQTVFEAAAEGDQGDFALTDIIGDPAAETDGADGGLGDPDPETVDGLCPFPGCFLGAEHGGAHALEHGGEG